MTPQAVPSDKGTIPQAVRLNPSLSERVLATTSLQYRALNDANQGPPPSGLSHLQVLIPIINPTGESNSPAVIVGIEPQSTIGDTPTHSIIHRWETVESRENLHSAFEQMGHRNNASSDPSNETVLRKLDPIITSKVIVGMHTMHVGKTVVITFADGLVEYRDRFTFEEIWTTEDLDRVMHLKQVGWSFKDIGPCKHRFGFDGNLALLT